MNEQIYNKQINKLINKIIDTMNGCPLFMKVAPGAMRPN